VNMVLIGTDILIDVEKEMQVIKKNLRQHKVDRRVMQISTGYSRSFRFGTLCICASSPRKSL